MPMTQDQPIPKEDLDRKVIELNPNTIQLFGSSENVATLMRDYTKFLGEVENPSKTSINPHFNSQYAGLEAVLNAVRPVLAKNNLSFIQFPNRVEKRICMATMIMHTCGAYMLFPNVLGPVLLQEDIQKQGALITYLRRFTLSPGFGVAGEVDDDGELASAPSAKGSVKKGTAKSTTVKKPTPELKKLGEALKGVDANGKKAIGAVIEEICGGKVPFSKIKEAQAKKVLARIKKQGKEGE